MWKVRRGARWLWLNLSWSWFVARNARASVWSNFPCLQSSQPPPACVSIGSRGWRNTNSRSGSGGGGGGNIHEFIVCSFRWFLILFLLFESALFLTSSSTTVFVLFSVCLSLKKILVAFFLREIVLIERHPQKCFMFYFYLQLSHWSTGEMLRSQASSLEPASLSCWHCRTAPWSAFLLMCHWLHWPAPLRSGSTKIFCRRYRKRPRDTHSSKLAGFALTFQKKDKTWKQRLEAKLGRGELNGGSN